MSSLYLSDLLKRSGIPIERTKLLRHSLKNAGFRLSYESGYLESYQALQSKNFFNGCDYVLSFVSEMGSSAKFMGCYKVGEKSLLATQVEFPPDFPAMDLIDEDIYYFELEKVDSLKKYEMRLIIDWGKAAISWQQWAKNEKEIIAIQNQARLAFTGFEDMILTHQELTEIVKDKTLYENWHAALSAVYAIYLITDRQTGKQYVGSAYGGEGLLGRWRSYVETKHGGNKGIIEAINVNPSQYQHFQFSVLQIIPKSATAEEVIAMENRHKQKLLSREFGMNQN